jgi:hypothetical protein
VHIRRRRRKTPAERILFTSQSSAEEINMLRTLMCRLNETVQSLWDTVHDLRLELDSIRPAGLDVDPSDQRPPTWRTPLASAGVTEQVETLQRQVDELTGDAEYLWSEAQWLRAQLAVYRGHRSP